MTRRAGKFTFGTETRATRSNRGWMMLLILALIGSLGAYWYFDPTAQPSFLADHLPSYPSAEITMYRWKDANGQWVVADQPPPEGVPFEIVNYRSDSNVIPRQDDDKD